ncbi:MAG TPA: hypothetical protein VKS78_04340 [Roseiarcus sp.]|nr:hypothetical protein [Roseiarcus sp.]
MNGIRFVRGAAAIGFLGVAVLASPAMAQTASLPPDTHFKAIKVDVRPLAQEVGEPTAGWVAQALPAALQAAFAGRLAPGDRAAPTLVVRVDKVFLGASGPGSLDPDGADKARDNMEGAGVIVGPNGRTLGVYPMFTVLDTYTGGTNYEVGTEQRRIGELAQSFAYWLPRQMGL